MAWEANAGALGAKAEQKFFEGKRDENDPLSVGFAVGCFYNSLDLIPDVIKRDAVTLHDRAGVKVL